MDLYNEYSFAEWIEPFVKAILKHAKIKAVEIYVEDMDEYNICLRVGELNTDGELIKNIYIIRYFDDDSAYRYPLFLYILYRDMGCYNARIEYGAYQIVRRKGVLRCVPLDK